MFAASLAKIPKRDEIRPKVCKTFPSTLTHLGEDARLRLLSTDPAAVGGDAVQVEAAVVVLAQQWASAVTLSCVRSYVRL